MMRFFYSLGIRLYYALIYLASTFHPKASSWIKGRNETWKKLQDISRDKEIIWIHCASLGEYLQGKEVIQGIRQRESSSNKIVLSFFSPSGFKNFKESNAVDLCVYLPLDTRRNAKRLLQNYRIRYAVFVKAEIWPNLWSELHRRRIPIFQIAASYDKDSAAIKNAFLRKHLRMASAIGVQDQDSLMLLHKIGIESSHLTGNPRADTTIQLSKVPFSDHRIEKFRDNRLLLIAGSTWMPDIQVLAEWHLKNKDNWQVIIAPHEVNTENVQKQINAFPKDSKISVYSSEPQANGDILFIDTIGLLARMYRYADMAYVGGGFGTGLHNTLEPAVYGICVAFGPKDQGFPEVAKLKDISVAHRIENFEDLQALTTRIENGPLPGQIRQEAEKYFKKHAGAAQKSVDLIYSKLK